MKSTGSFQTDGEVERLVELALVDRAVADEVHGDAVGALVLLGEREPAGERHVAGDDRVAAHERLRDVEEVHRAAAAAGDARLLAEQLGHDAVRVEPARERVAVLAVVA